MGAIGWVIFSVIFIVGIIGAAGAGLDMGTDIGDTLLFAIPVSVAWAVLSMIFPSDSKRSEAELAQAKDELAERLKKNDAEKYAQYQEGRRLEFERGPLMPKVVCPHCQEVGHVRVKQTTVEERSHETGIGAIIGPERIAKKNVQAAACDNCNMSWII